MSVDKHDREKGRDIDSPLDEKRPASELSSELFDGDEALRLVGAVRTAHFSEEYNLKLRRKLVRNSYPWMHICFDVCYQ